MEPLWSFQTVSPRARVHSVGCFAVEPVILLAVLIFAAAILYSSVGHAGASGYLAAMALVGVAPDVMKPTALALNILVATIAAVRLYRAGYCCWSALWPFAIGSIPLSFIGGAIILPGYLYKPAVGIVLLYAAYRLFRSTMKEPQEPADKSINIPTAPAIASGSVIGLLSGLTGTGGGIFLSPLLLFTGWADTKMASGVAAVFILVNSIAGLLGNLASVSSLPSDLPLFVGAALLGAVIGTTLGIKLATPIILKTLGAVLVIAGLKMIGGY